MERRRPQHEMRETSFHSHHHGARGSSFLDRAARYQQQQQQHQDQLQINVIPRGSTHSFHSDDSTTVHQPLQPQETCHHNEEEEILRHRQVVKWGSVKRVVFRESRQVVDYDTEPKLMETLWRRHVENEPYEEEEEEKDCLPSSLADIKGMSVKMAVKKEYAHFLGLSSSGQQEAGQDNSFSGSTSKKMVTSTKTNYDMAVDKVSLTLWNASLWRIQGRFGSTTASFFKFLLWTLVLNSCSTLFILGLIVTPQLVLDGNEKPVEDNKTPNCPGIFDHNEVWYEETNASTCCSYDYERTIEDFSYNVTNFFSDLEDILLAILQGTDWMETSSMFYGYYSGTFKFDLYGYTFDFPLAYFLVMLSVFLLNLGAVVVSSAQGVHAGLQKSFAKEDGSIGLAHIVFGGWDYQVSSEESVVIQKADLAGKLRLGLASKYKRRQKEVQSRVERHKQLFVRILVNLFVLCSLAGTAYLIYWITADATPNLLVQRSCSSSNFNDANSTDFLENALCFAIEYLPSITITVANLFFPFIFTMLIEYEQYEANTKLFLNLSRCILLRLASLLITLLSLLTTVNCTYATGCTNQDMNSILFENCNGNDNAYYKTCSNVNVDSEFVECKKPICWETYVGQQFYKLALLDFFVQVGLVLLFDMPRFYLIGHLMEGMKGWEGFRNNFGVINFNVTKNVLDIVYSQTICWLALFYSPLITVVTVVKSAILFYLKIFHVQHICTPTNIPYSASRASGFFKFCLLLSFVGCTAAVGVFISYVQPSTACGPFRDVECFLDENYNITTHNCKVYDYVEGLVVNSNEQLKTILFFIGEATFLYCFGGLLVLIVYLYSALSSADASLAKELKKECKMEGVENTAQKRRLQLELQTLYNVNNPPSYFPAVLAT